MRLAGREGLLPPDWADDMEARREVSSRHRQLTVAVLIFVGAHVGLFFSPAWVPGAAASYLIVVVASWRWMAARAAGTRPKTDAEIRALRWPTRSRLGRWLAAIASSTTLRDLLRPLPFLELRSDVLDVVYLNWMVPTERVAKLLPAPLSLDESSGYTAVSILTYRHGSFGPALFGPLRRLMPSPEQSNWRLYLDMSRLESSETQDAIYFFKTCLGSAPLVVLSRLLADGLPAHLPAKLEHRRRGHHITTVLLPGESNAPDLEVTVCETERRELPSSWQRHFPDWAAAVLYLVSQNRAVSVEPSQGCVLESRIDIPIDVASVSPADVEAFESSWLAPIVAGCPPFAFVVARVPFRALGEGPVAALTQSTR